MYGYDAIKLQFNLCVWMICNPWMIGIVMAWWKRADLQSMWLEVSVMAAYPMPKLLCQINGPYLLGMYVVVEGKQYFYVLIDDMEMARLRR